MVKNLIFFFVLLSSSLNASEFGPWPQGYFLDKGLLNCVSLEECRSPQISDIQTLRDDWQRLEEKRIEHLDSLKGQARLLLDGAMERAQSEVMEYEASEYGRILMEKVNDANSKLSPLLQGEYDLWVSNSSPVYGLFNSLEDLIHQGGVSRLDKKIYHEWFNKEETQLILSKIDFVEKSFFKNSKEESLLSFLREEFFLADGAVLKNCPKPVEEALIKMMGRGTFFKDPKGELPSLIEDGDKFRAFYLSSRQENELIIECDQKKVFGQPKLKDLGQRRYELSYKVSQGKYKLPDSSELRVLKP